jgi:glutathione S-transferase kappa 1
MTQSRGGKLTIYVDCGQYRPAELIKIVPTPPVSPYSWFGFTNVRNFRPQLESHGIEVCIEPFFLGGARDGVGNPYTPPPQAKAAFAQQDLDFTSKLLGLEVVRPKVFPISSLFVSILHSTSHIKN